MISPLLRQSFLLSSSTVFMFSIQTASTGPSNMYQRFSSVIDEAPIRINAGKMPSVLHTHRTCCKSARHWLYQRRQDSVCPVHTHRTCCKSVRHWLYQRRQDAVCPAHTQNVLQVGPSLADGGPLATPHRQQIGVASTTAIGTYDSCCVSDGCKRQLLTQHAGGNRRSSNTK